VRGAGPLATRSMRAAPRLLLAALAAAATASTAASAGAARAPEEVGGFEMTTYQVAFLRRGPAWTPGETPELQKLQEAHMAHIRAMGESGKLLVAGPFSDGGDLRGMFIFRSDTLEEARALAEQDPAVKAGRLALEWHPWFAAKNIRVTAHSEK
jgi:uncharacterized protein YciI